MKRDILLPSLLFCDWLLRMSLFSIVIPTRNRPELVTQAVASVLEQDFKDFELIVSDNSDSDRANENLKRLTKILSGSRVRYVRPDRILSMKDHWEWAVKNATGEFVGILTDRYGYKLNALTLIEDVFRRYSTSLVSFRGDHLHGKKPPLRLRRRFTSGQVKRIYSRTLLLNCSESIFPDSIPRLLNCFCRRQLLIDIENVYGSVFSGLSPDFNFGFRVLDHLGEFTYIDRSLLISGGDGSSNGQAFMLNQPNEHSRDFLKLSDNENLRLKFSPLPNAITLESAILTEYEIARSQQRSGHFHPINPAEFYRISCNATRRRLDRGYDFFNVAKALEIYRKKHGLPVGNISVRVWAWRGWLRIAFDPIKHFLRPFSDLIMRFVVDYVPILQSQISMDPCRYRSFSSLIEALHYDYKMPPPWGDKIVVSLDAPMLPIDQAHGQARND